MKIPIEISARHIHLSQKDLIKLFGPGCRLKKLHPLSQEGEFASQEEVKVIGKKACLEVRVVGPVRKNTQLEISATDAYRLGIKAPVRLSGDLEGTPGITVCGPQDKVTLKKGVIIARRHIHLNKEEAKRLKLEHRSSVKVKTRGERGLVFDQVLIRVGDTFHLSMHIDTDEANAAGLWGKKNFGELIFDCKC